ncbi:DUF4397 domain-containing protein [Romboutsia timonensis]|uniref:DUF4397 domain-containing protein n=1 Tax=Romboutsia timonensis TaxID=1776391 RepID=UPI002A7665CC|nr:DUF4397 domain-containing protein [Romboutsia timonensis]MDY3000134.1 DUF4397 domain-containing protein [Romboutsia timonensis]MDY3958330.1 DUF4397 domain-containing protein [Romboutsia timonensis]
MDCFEIKNNSSLVRVFHAAPQAPNVDVYVNDQMVFSNLAFGDFTRYVYLDEGEYNVSVYLAGQKDRPVINQMVDVPSQQIFTIAATGNLDNLGLLVIPDKVSKSPSQNYSSVRVIHLSPNAPGVDILVDGDTLFEDISFGEGTDYVDLNPGTYNVNVVLNTDKSVVLPLKVTLNPDKIYTIYIIGNPPTLQALQVVDGNTYACR